MWGGAWKDAASYPGWDTGVAAPGTKAVTSVAWSPNMADDDTLVAITTNDQQGDPNGTATYQQSGLWGTTKAWNNQAGSPFPSAAVLIMDVAPFNWWGFGGGPFWYCPLSYATGIAMPEDFTGYDSDLRQNWVYVNFDTPAGGTSIIPASFAAANAQVGQVFRVKGSGVKFAGIRCAQWDTTESHPLMSSIAMTGTIDDGALMVGLKGQATNTNHNGWETVCCEGVQVYRTAEWPIDYCCPQWNSAKKPPTGEHDALVAYVDDGDKGYAATGSGESTDIWDESAFSWSEIDEVGKYWNQPSLIDTCSA